MNINAKQVRRGRKFEQVLEGARDVFLKDGFEGASVDEIARVAKVSKATLYSYFPDKRLLFMEVANSECMRQSQEAIESIVANAPPRDVLSQVGHQFLRFITSTFGQQIFRICVAQSDRFPEIGQQFYNSGPTVMCNELTQYFEQAEERGELKIEDHKLAADQFCELCKADIWPRLMFGISQTVTDDEINRVVDGAVEMFVARYGV